MSKRDVARMWVQEITGGRKPRLCIEKGEDNLVVVATFESTNHSNYFEEIIHEMCEELKQYRAIGTVSEFRQLKEKATAKNPIEAERNNLTVWDCPQCGNELYSGQKFCDECGKAIADEFE